MWWSWCTWVRVTWVLLQFKLGILVGNTDRVDDLANDLRNWNTCLGHDKDIKYSRNQVWWRYKGFLWGWGQETRCLPQGVSRIVCLGGPGAWIRGPNECDTYWNELCFYYRYAPRSLDQGTMDWEVWDVYFWKLTGNSPSSAQQESSRKIVLL